MWMAPPTHAHTPVSQPTSLYNLLFTLPAVPLCNLWVIGTDGWQLLAVSLGSSTPLPCSTAPGLLQLMAWLRRLPRNSNAAPISFSASGGVMRGRGGVRWWRRLEREDYCWQRRNAVGSQARTRTQSLGCKVVCVCMCALTAGVHSCMLSFFSSIFRCVCGCVITAQPVPAWGTVLCRFTNAHCTEKDTVRTAG